MFLQPPPVGVGGTKAVDISSDEDDFSPYGITSRDERGSDSEERHDELAKPEFEGLWTKQHKDYRVSEKKKGFIFISVEQAWR